ncbi:MAG: amidohydrolase family protein [Pseudomonadota bacterium]
MTYKPAKLLGIQSGQLKAGLQGDVILFDLDEKWSISALQNTIHNPLGLKHHTPFYDTTLKGKIKQTFINGRKIYDDHDAHSKSSSKCHIF